MKAKHILLIAALAGFFCSCENKEPFDTQSPDDYPLILVPYETETGLIYGKAKNPDPYVDSVIVTPSKYTTVNWYLDGTLVYTGTKINKCFPTGTYDLLIEAVTDKYRTTRSGMLTVESADADPYANASSGTHHLAPGVESSLTGNNLDKVSKIIIARDIYGTDTFCTLVPTYKEAKMLKFTIPAMADAEGYLRLQDSLGTIYGSDALQIHNNPLVLSGYDKFFVGEEWTITGVKLQDVASIKLGDQVITSFTATASNITLTAPILPVKTSYALSITNKDGSAVLFSTDNGVAEEVQTYATPEKSLWTGPLALIWDENRIRITKETMAQVNEGDSIRVYFSVLPSGDPNYYDYEAGEVKMYWCLRIITNGWAATDDVLSQVDGMDKQPNPYSFAYTAERKALVESKGWMALVGWGLQIERVTFEQP